MGVRFFNIFSIPGTFKYSNRGSENKLSSTHHRSVNGMPLRSWSVTQCKYCDQVFTMGISKLHCGIIHVIVVGNGNYDVVWLRCYDHMAIVQF